MTHLEQLEQLLVAHDNSPHDETILSAIAIYYIHHPDGNKDLDYLKKGLSNKSYRRYHQ